MRLVVYEEEGDGDSSIGDEESDDEDEDEEEEELTEESEEEVCCKTNKNTSPLPSITNLLIFLVAIGNSSHCMINNLQRITAYREHYIKL